MNHILKQILKTILSGITAIIVLSLFCLVYSYSGIHINNTSNATDYKWQPNQYKSTMTEGFAWMHFDANGFNNINSYTKDIDVLIMGSSHMEAIQVPQKDNVSELLNKQLSYKVYNIGMSGHQIYNIVNNYKNALEYYSPKKYVIIETDNISLNEKDMKEVIEGKYEKIPSYDKGIMYYAQKVPAIKNIYKQLQDWLALEKNTSESTNSLKTKTNIEMLKEFLLIISSESNNYNVKPIIFYHPSESLDKNGNVNYNTNQENLDAFKKACDELGIVFLDMSKSFNEVYKKEHKLAHGFSNTHVGSGHLNVTGHKVIADEITRVIKEMEGELICH